MEEQAQKARAESNEQRARRVQSLRSTAGSLRALRHVGLIPDGGRRWAAREGVALSHAYDVTLTGVAEVARLCFGRGTSIVSIYALSSLNLGRQPDEIEALAASLCRFANGELRRLAKDTESKVRVVGDLSALPPCMSEAHSNLSKAGLLDGHRLINVLLGYSSAHEIDEAQVLSCDQGVPLLQALLVPDALDLVIRTGGARVLSDFLPLQSAYAQIAFLPDLWNDLSLTQVESLADRVQSLRPLFGE